MGVDAGRQVGGWMGDNKKYMSEDRHNEKRRNESRNW